MHLGKVVGVVRAWEFHANNFEGVYGMDCLFFPCQTKLSIRRLGNLQAELYHGESEGDNSPSLDRDFLLIDDVSSEAKKFHW